MVNKQILSRHLTRLKKKKPIQWLRQTISGLKSLVLRLAIRGGCISLCSLSLLWVFGQVPSVLLVLLSIFVLMTLYPKRSEHQKTPEFETFYTKNILLNEGLRAWMAPVDQRLPRRSSSKKATRTLTFNTVVFLLKETH